MSGPFRVAGGSAFTEHLPPREVGAGREELRTKPVAEGGGLREVRVRLVVAAEDGGKTTEKVTDRAFNRGAAAGGHLSGPRGEPVEDRPGVLWVPAFDRSFGIVDHAGEP